MGFKLVGEWRSVMMENRMDLSGIYGMGWDGFI